MRASFAPDSIPQLSSTLPAPDPTGALHRYTLWLCARGSASVHSLALCQGLCMGTLWLCAILSPPQQSWKDLFVKQAEVREAAILTDRVLCWPEDTDSVDLSISN